MSTFFAISGNLSARPLFHSHALTLKRLSFDSLARLTLRIQQEEKSDMNFSTQDLESQMRKLSQINGHLTYRINKLSKLLESEAMLRLKGSGINLTTYRIMLVVSIFEEITVSDLARLMVIDRAQVSRLATDMTKQGLLTSKPDRSNKLKKLLMLTPEGHARFAVLREKFEDRQSLVTAHASEEELDVLWRLIERVSQSLTDRIERAV